MSEKIIVMTYMDRRNPWEQKEKYVSHGIKEDLSGHVVLENCPLSDAIASGWVRFDKSLGEYILD